MEKMKTKVHYKPISRRFPATHPKKGQPTNFVEKIWNAQEHWQIMESLKCLNPKLSMFEIREFYGSLDFHGKFDPKGHTIRQGNKVKVGDFIQLYCWGTNINYKSGRSGPYHSKQIKIAPPIKVKKVWDFEIKYCPMNGTGFFINDEIFGYEKMEMIAKNDGLERKDLYDWFKFPSVFKGQIICWNENIGYL